MTIWVLVKSDVSTNIVSAQPEEIAEMFERIKRGERVYDALGRDVTYEVVDTIATLYEYDAMKVILEGKDCEVFRKGEDIALLAAIAKIYNIDINTIVKAVQTMNPNLIMPPKCLA